MPPENWERVSESWERSLAHWQAANKSWKAANCATLMALTLSVLNFSWFAWMAFHNHGR